MYYIFKENICSACNPTQVVAFCKGLLILKKRRLKFSHIKGSIIPQKYKNTRNNNDNIFIVLGALKSLLCFPLDIDVNDDLNYRTKYLLRKCRKKKTITNKQDCLSTHVLIVTFYEIAINYEPELNILLFLTNISMNRNMGFLRSFHFKFYQIIYLFKRFNMLWRIFIYAVCCLVVTFQRSRLDQSYLSNITYFVKGTISPKCF